MLEMIAGISMLTRDHFTGTVESLKKLAKHDHVITLYGTYDVGTCTVIEYPSFGEYHKLGRSGIRGYSNNVTTQLPSMIVHHLRDILALSIPPQGR